MRLMRLTLLACLLALAAAHASADGSRAESCGECREEIQELEKKIGELPQGDTQLPDLLLRLGALHQEASEFYRSPRYQDTSTSGLERFTYSREAYRKAEAQYTRLLAESPRFKRRDEALSLLLQLYLTNSQTQKALGAYERLSKEHPKSRSFPATHFAVGEHLFVRSKGQPEKLEKAREAYRKAASFPGSPLQFQALSLQGWCSFYLNDLKDTQAAWRAAALSHRAKARRKPASAEDRKLIDQLILDCVKVFARVGDAHQARKDFSKLASGPDERIALMMLLDLLYRESGSGKEREAAITLAELDKDCKGGKARACNALGLLYMEGAGVEADTLRAAQLFEKACRGKLTAGCYNFCDPEVEKADSASSETRADALREKVCEDALSPVFGDEAAAQAFWEPLERIDRRSPSAFSRLVGDTKDTPLALLLRDIDDRYRERMALYPEEEREMTPAESAPKLDITPFMFEVARESLSKPKTEAERINEENLRSAMVSHELAVRGCYEQARKRNSSLKGALMVRFVVRADGAVSWWEIDRRSLTLEDEPMKMCIVELVKGWKFLPLVGGGKVLVHYPFVFKPGPDPVPQ